MRQTLKNIFYGAIHSAGVTRLARRLRRRHVPVLFYHGVATRRWPGVLDCERKHILASALERHLSFLKENFQVVPLSRYADSLRGGPPLPEPCAVVTFDDGYTNNYSLAFPLLKKYALPATVYLAADFVTQGQTLWVDRLAWAFENTQAAPLEKILSYLKTKNRLKSLPDEERESLADKICAELLGPRPPETPPLFAPLSRQQAREMAGSGLVEFGSHGCRHAILTNVTLEQARQEIVSSKRIIEDFCGRPVASFSYPNGDFNAEIARMTAEAGYSSAVAGGLRLNAPDRTDPYAIARLALAEDDTPALIAATLCGIRGRLISWAGGPS